MNQQEIKIAYKLFKAINEIYEENDNSQYGLGRAFSDAVEIKHRTIDAVKKYGDKAYPLTEKQVAYIISALKEARATLEAQKVEKAQEILENAVHVAKYEVKVSEHRQREFERKQVEEYRRQIEEQREAADEIEELSAARWFRLPANEMFAAADLALAIQQARS